MRQGLPYMDSVTHLTLSTNMQLAKLSIRGLIVDRPDTTLEPQG